MQHRDYHIIAHILLNKGMKRHTSHEQKPDYHIIAPILLNKGMKRHMRHEQKPDLDSESIHKRWTLPSPLLGYKGWMVGREALFIFFGFLFSLKSGFVTFAHSTFTL